MVGENEIYGDLKALLITREEIAAKVQEIGEKITADYQGKKPVMICILKGSAIFFADLVRAVKLPVKLDFMQAASYGKSTKSSGIIRILKDLDQEVRGQDVILVEDIVDSGHTLSHLVALMQEREVASVRVVTLLDKPSRREVPDLKVDYHCFDIPDEFVVGYGLDFDQRYRNLPDIGVLKPSVYGKV